MKIIFLDVDGVLNSETDFIEVAMYGNPINGVKYKLDDGREVIMPINTGKLALLEKIILNTDAKLVITSTWRNHLKLTEIHEKFESMGFRLPRTCIAGKTKSTADKVMDHTYSRALEISEWLETHDDIESYVILDDIRPELFRDHIDNLVTTSEYDGLNNVLANRAITILGRNEQGQKEYNRYI